VASVQLPQRYDWDAAGLAFYFPADWQVTVKDTGAVLPGHGGMLDRIDSWIWGLPIGYYLVLWLFI